MLRAGVRRTAGLRAEICLYAAVAFFALAMVLFVAGGSDAKFYISFGAMIVFLLLLVDSIPRRLASIRIHLPDPPEHYPMGPIEVITTVGAGLKVIEQFREVAGRLFGRQPTDEKGNADGASESAKIADGKLEIVTNGTRQVFSPDKIDINQWDEVRLRSLKKKIDDGWAIFNSLDEQLETMSALEIAKTRVTMEDRRKTLCANLRELIGIYERLFGVKFPSKYSLLDMCPES
jgi:hypothetical protein